MWSTIASQMNLINAFSKLSKKRSQMVWAFPWKTLIDLRMFLGKIGEVKKNKKMATTVAMQKELKRKVHVEAVCLLLSFVGIYSLLMNGKHRRAPKKQFWSGELTLVLSFWGLPKVTFQPLPHDDSLSSTWCRQCFPVKRFFCRHRAAVRGGKKALKERSTEMFDQCDDGIN